MIRFKCIYCGQRILAREDVVGKKGKCPKCAHLLTVPKTTKGRPAIDSDIPEQIQQSMETAAPVSAAFTKSEETVDKGIVDKTLEAYDLKPDSFAKHQHNDLVELYREKVGWFIPTYDKLSLFLMAVTWVSLYLANSHLRERIHTFLVEANDWRVSLLALTVPAVLILCIYQVFTKREKSDLEKTIMLWFAIATNLLTGIVAGIYLLKNTDFLNWPIIFPIWNFVNATLLYLMLELNIVDENCIVDRDATAIQIILGLMAVIIIVLVCNFVFKLHWSITFSICIVYTTSFDRALQSVFPGLAYRGDEKADSAD